MLRVTKIGVQHEHKLMFCRSDKGEDWVSLPCNPVNLTPCWQRQVANQKETLREKEGQWILRGRGKMVVGLICFPANAIVFAFIAFAPDNVHGLAQDRPDSITPPEAFPELIKDSRMDANSGQKRFSALLEWM